MIESARDLYIVVVCFFCVGCVFPHNRHVSFGHSTVYKYRTLVLSLGSELVSYYSEDQTAISCAFARANSRRVSVSAQDFEDSTNTFTR